GHVRDRGPGQGVPHLVRCAAPQSPALPARRGDRHVGAIPARRVRSVLERAPAACTGWHVPGEDHSRAPLLLVAAGAGLCGHLPARARRPLPAPAHGARRVARAALDRLLELGVLRGRVQRQLALSLSRRGGVLPARGRRYSSLAGTPSVALTAWLVRAG